MNINKLVEKVKTIVLERLEFSSFNLGNEWDQSTQKGDQYPTAWLELPYLVDYQVVGKGTKVITFSIVFLNIPKYDNLSDEVNMISHMEEYADLFIKYLKDEDYSVVSATGLTVKTINADYACGIRLDVKINTGRTCAEICEIEESC